jgi:hypothetical protein
MNVGTWWPLGGVSRTNQEQLDDLETILNEAPAVLHHTCTADVGEADHGAAAATKPPLGGAGADDAGLPVSSSCPLPNGGTISPEKIARSNGHGQASASQPWATYVPPSVAAWLPACAEAHPAAAAEGSGGWRAYVPAALVPRFAGSSSMATQRTTPPQDAAASTALVQPQPPSSPGAAPSGWADHAQQQVAAACRATLQQLATAGASTAGTVALGAALGGAVAGPLGLAAGAKSGAALVAAGAVSGAAVKRYALSPSKQAAKREGSEERELQPLSPSATPRQSPQQ